jgi:tight adherence protein B
VIGLTAGLLALAGILAERAVAITRSDRITTRLGVERSSRRVRRPNTWVLAGAGLALVVIVAGVGIGLATAGCTAVTVHSVRRRRRARQRQRADEQIVDAVGAVSAGLRAGLSLPQAFAYARDEVEEPLRTELVDLVGAIETGTPVGEALNGWAEAHGTEDARLIAGVLDLHRRSGGDLPVVLDGLTGTLRERRAAHRDVRALTAQARLSGVILGLLPIGFFAFLLLTSRREMLDAIATPIGGTALAVGLGLELVAFAWIRHLLQVR